jgi:hypothetical protein
MGKFGRDQVFLRLCCLFLVGVFKYHRILDSISVVDIFTGCCYWILDFTL